MHSVAGQSIRFLCQIMRNAGHDPEEALVAAGLPPSDALPERVSGEAATTFAQQLEAMPEALVAMRARSPFLTVLNHELRTPLNGVVGFAEVLAGTELSLDQRAMLEQLRASADAMTSLLDDLLALSEHVNGANRVLLPPPVHEPSSVEEPPARARVLVVDDNATNRVVAARLVERMGFEVDTASNGSEAVEALRRSTYGIVLMDCFMPVMDGFDAARAIRESEVASGRHTPIVAVSANVQAHDRERCHEAGMDDFVSKPIRSAALETVISRWCRRADAPEDDVETMA